VSSPQKKPDRPLTPRHAWQPLTPRGVAAFAQATTRRLVIVQFIVAAMVVASLLWFLQAAWAPVLTDAMRALPESGSIRAGELDFHGTSGTLAANARLGFSVEASPELTPNVRVADLEVWFGKTGVALCGALGCRRWNYPANYTFGFNRSEAQAAWGAWRWAIITVVSAGTFVSLLLMWWLLSVIYVPLVKMLALFTDRQITWAGSWRLACAALLPGALLVAASLVLYGAGLVDLFRFALLQALHLLAGLVFVVTSPFFLPSAVAGKPGGNPFGSPAKSAKASRSSSPFSRQSRQ
jgi:hypothetical protein